MVGSEVMSSVSRNDVNFYYALNSLGKVKNNLKITSISVGVSGVAAIPRFLFFYPFNAAMILNTN